MTKAIVFNPIFLESNLGHGNARRISLENCKNKLVALMDANERPVIVYTQEVFEKYPEMPQFSDNHSCTARQWHLNSITFYSSIKIIAMSSRWFVKI